MITFSLTSNGAPKSPKYSREEGSFWDSDKFKSRITRAMETARINNFNIITYLPVGGRSHPIEGKTKNHMPEIVHAYARYYLNRFTEMYN